MASDAWSRVYCGAPPSPDILWARWNLDPVLLTVLVACLAAYALGAQRRSGPVGAAQKSAFVAGWLTATAALISPLCALSVSLFSARVGQHMILSLIAAPLIVLGRPGEAYGALVPEKVRALMAKVSSGAAISTAAFAASMWFWHAPGPYAATFASPIVYWLMHLTVFFSALMVWRVILDGRARALPSLVAGACSTLQMTALGALIAMARSPMYGPHLATTYAWGLSPQADQQLGGLIMWVPGCTIFLAATIFTLGQTLRERPDAQVAV